MKPQNNYSLNILFYLFVGQLATFQFVIKLIKSGLFGRACHTGYKYYDLVVEGENSGNQIAQNFDITGKYGAPVNKTGFGVVQGGYLTSMNSFVYQAPLMLACNRYPAGKMFQLSDRIILNDEKDGAIVADEETLRTYLPY